MNTASLEHLHQIAKGSLVRHTFMERTHHGSLGSQGSQGSQSDTHSGRVHSMVA